jgi:hypothetical protein
MIVIGKLNGCYADPEDIPDRCQKREVEVGRCAYSRGIPKATINVDDVSFYVIDAELDIQC